MQRKPIRFIDLLQDIKDDKIDKDNIKIEYLDNKYKYDKNTGIFVSLKDSNVLLSDMYSDLDLLDMTVILLLDDCNDRKLAEWEEKVLEDLITKYITIEIELDNSQGCISNLKDLTDEMNYYKECIKNLGCDFDVWHTRYFNIVVNRLSKEQEKHDEEQIRKDNIIKLLDLDIFKLINIKDKTVSDSIYTLYDKINEICHILRGDK